ncbi:hypothetical protein Halar_0508 (plasmid) [halophilic archaeon DL31]|jgi:hypothetical protein|nr:hypothetical protein Halar_0508 [halophilic archaeon DL31]
MVDWGNPQDMIEISYSIMYSVNTFQQSPRTQDRQPVDENPHYQCLNDDEKRRTLLNNLCDSSTCPLCRDVEDDCEYLYLESSDIGSFIATLEAEDENPYDWD